MSDLKKYIEKRKEYDSDFAKNFEDGYHKFKIGGTVQQVHMENEEDENEKVCAQEAQKRLQDYRY